MTGTAPSPSPSRWWPAWPPPSGRRPGPPGEAATVEQTDQFLAAYEQARGRPWTPAVRQACWAAGLWVQAFSAKKQHMAGGDPDLDRLAAEVPERAPRAGLDP
jgi:hypothetical protein